MAKEPWEEFRENVISEACERSGREKRKLQKGSQQQLLDAWFQSARPLRPCCRCSVLSAQLYVHALDPAHHRPHCRECAKAVGWAVP